MSTPFSAIMIGAALVLPETTIGMIEGVDHSQLLDSSHPKLCVDYGPFKLAHHAGVLVG